MDRVGDVESLTIAMSANRKQLSILFHSISENKKWKKKSKLINRDTLVLDTSGMHRETQLRAKKDKFEAKGLRVALSL